MHVHAMHVHTCRASEITPLSSVSGERRSSLMSRWWAVPSSSGVEVGTSMGTWLSLPGGVRCAPGSKRHESKILRRSGDCSEWMRSSVAKKETTRGMRR